MTDIPQGEDLMSTCFRDAAHPIRRETLTQRFDVPTTMGNSHPVEVRVPVYTCDSCDDSWTDSVGEKLRDAAALKARLDTEEELQAIAQTLDVDALRDGWVMYAHEFQRLHNILELINQAVLDEGMFLISRSGAGTEDLSYHILKRAEPK
jgi:hypothetical protein